MASVKQRKASKTRSGLLFALMGSLVLTFGLSSGCARVKIKDSEWCGDIGTLGAECFHTLTDGERSIPKAIWDLDRFGMVCTTADTFADWKMVIEQLCSSSSNCDDGTKKSVEDFFRRVDNFNLGGPNTGMPLSR